MEQVNFDVWKVLDWLIDELKARDAKIQELEEQIKEKEVHISILMESRK